jgi:hypothetical protein
MRWLLLTALAAGACLAQPQIVHTIDAPDTGISGLGYGDGSLWAVDGATEMAYEVDPADGAVLESWYCENSTKVPSGLAFAGGNVYIVMANPSGTYAYGYRYTQSGSYQSSFSMDC